MTQARDWDAFAPEYATIQRESRLPIETDVTTQIQSWYPKGDWTVADIAAGSGRYALPLTTIYHTVQLIDWSVEMLNQASQWLMAHQRTNFTRRTADWHDLPAQPIGDLVFVSQLPELTAGQLPALAKLARRGVILNQQTEQRNLLLEAVAKFVGVTVPLPMQVAPQRVTSWQAALTSAGIPFRLHRFTYELPTTTSIAELLPELPIAIGATRAQQLAALLTPGKEAHELVTTTTRYTFTLLTWTT